MEKPDNGDIILFGNSILKNKKFLYKNIGVCDQENNFFKKINGFLAPPPLGTNRGGIKMLLTRYLILSINLKYG